MKTLIQKGFPKQLKPIQLKQISYKAQRTDTFPVQSGKPSQRTISPSTQLQEKAFQQVKHLHQTAQANHVPTSVRTIANLYFLERRIFW
ncbi:hypothetical protein IQ266_07310 [filamentous cyanobacterium LEGE 11480]|uniref:Uncharacterized protein n=1 Tax=Romeriopsis navalis LEGE 11480 TaxID=2777977 RepID=A0A928Z3S6_9CYAN|nr:hypothetical protein [Romeriopsis navalis]MBE9029568.1 hypothetical protein [Romeriopsis navalis LEGE 11480]